MLQQTQVARVRHALEAWLDRWPTVEALAAAPRSDVIRAWDGLGYNRRAVNLHRAAIDRRPRLAGRPDGASRGGPLHGRRCGQPRFGAKVLPVDVNVRRVLERSGLEFDHECGPALMGLGAQVCIARVPRCDVCPLAEHAPRAGGFRARAQAVALRGLVPPAPRMDAAARRRTSRAEEPSSTTRPSRRSPRDGLVEVRERSGSAAYSTGQLTTMGAALIDSLTGGGGPANGCGGAKNAGCLAVLPGDEPTPQSGV